jgi:hypothetical protein
MDEVDELLLEQELLSPVSASQTREGLNHRNSGSNGKNESLKNMTKEELKNKISKDFGNDPPAFDDDDEFDLDNSDDLNRFINKYEQMLSSKPAAAPSKPTLPAKQRSGNLDDIDYLVEEELSRKSEDEPEIATMKVEISSKPTDVRRQSTPSQSQ